MLVRLRVAKNGLVEVWRRQAKRRATRLLDLPYAPQMDDASCGPACLLMLLRYYGAALPQGRQPRCRAGAGTSFPALIRLVRSLDLVPVLPPRRIRARRLTQPLALIDRGVPVILAFGDAGTETTSHYAVLVGYSATELFFHDPFLRPFFPRNRRTFTEKWERENRWFVGVKAPKTREVQEESP